MELTTVAQRARDYAVMVRVQGPDPKGLKMRRHAFYRHESGSTTLSASGLLLPSSLRDSLPIVSNHMRANSGSSSSGQLSVVVTLSSIVEPFLSAQHTTGYNDSTQGPLLHKLIPGARIDVLKEGNKETDSSTTLHCLEAHLLALVDISPSSSALQSLVGNQRGLYGGSSWVVGWSLDPLDSGHQSTAKTLQHKTLTDSAMDELASSSHMVNAKVRVAFLGVSTADHMDLLSINTAKPQQIGDQLLVMGSPFGVLSPLHFFNSISVGTVANSSLTGSTYCSLLMADIRCFPGMEGSPVFDKEACLAGILARPVKQKGCTTEIQLVIPWNAIATACGELQKQSETANAEMNNVNFSHHPRLSPLEKAIASTVLVTVGDAAWASGILLNNHGLILTNAHLLEPWRFGRTTLLNTTSATTMQSVPQENTGQDEKQLLHPSLFRASDTSVGKEHDPPFLSSDHNNYKHVRVRLNNTEPWIWCDARVVYVCKGPMDVALLQLESIPEQLCTIRPDFMCPFQGLKVHVIGHGPFGPRSDILPYVSSGVVARVVRTMTPLYPHKSNILVTEESCSPVMLETTASVYPGMSGGAVVNSDGHMIGLITSNAKHGGRTVIPHLNFVIPCAALDPIFKFSEKRDLSILQVLDQPDMIVSNVWALMPLPSSSAPRPESLLDKNEGKGSRFAKFLAEKHADIILPPDQEQILLGKFSNIKFRSKM